MTRRGIMRARDILRRRRDLKSIDCDLEGRLILCRGYNSTQLRPQRRTAIREHGADRRPRLNNQQLYRTEKSATVHKAA